MLAPTLNTRPFFLAAAAATGQTLPEPAALVLTVVQGTATAGVVSNLTVVTSAPGAGQVQSTATPQTPSAALTLNAAPSAGILLGGAYVPRGSLPAAA
jgi:hypothetical protein